MRDHYRHTRIGAIGIMLVGFAILLALIYLVTSHVPVVVDGMVLPSPSPEVRTIIDTVVTVFVCALSVCGIALLAHSLWATWHPRQAEGSARTDKKRCAPKGLL